MPDLFFQIMFFNVVLWVFIMTPLYGLVIALPAIALFQLEKTPYGQRQFVTLDVVAYRGKITKTYLFLVLGLALGALANALGFIADVTMPHGLLSIVIMGALLNFAAKRLGDLGRARAFAALGVLPILGPAFFIWLAYAQRKSQK